VKEIQEALVREGYLQGEPTGQWDSHTHDAMQRYQTVHGFPSSGLPEAKSLMKLGLGSHPLPPELDRGSARVAVPNAARGEFTWEPPALTEAPAESPSPTIASPETK
jgi:peptidoglycan hydrolase-like protein with peptidoglycan-binding domain